MFNKVSLASDTRRQEEFVEGGGAAADGVGEPVSTESHPSGNTAPKVEATFNLDAELRTRLKVTAARQDRETVEIVEEGAEGASWRNGES